MLYGRIVHRCVIFSFTEKIRIVTAVEYSENILIAVHLQLRCTHAGGDEPVKAEFLFQGHDAAAAAEGYSQVAPLGRHLLEIRQQCVVYLRSTLVYLPEVFLIAAVSAGQMMGLLLRISIRSVVTLV